jgi:nitrilase
MKVAAIQLASGSKIKANLREAAKLISNASAEGAELIVLPENFGMIGNRQEDVLEQREAAGNGLMQDFLAQQSQKYGITLVGGSVPIASEDSVRYRSALLVYNKGECIARYDKIHLFDVSVPGSNEKYRESDVIEAGDSIVIVDTGTIKLGLAICYDLRFPEMFRLLQDKGAEVIVLPAAFTAVTGQAHWHALLKARAIENLCYIVASAQGGFHVNGRETYGHSLIIEPWGNILDEIATGSGFALADIRLDQQQQIRERFPVLTHRRYSVNSKIE